MISFMTLFITVHRETIPGLKNTPIYLMVGNFSYDGPLPTGTELLIVSGFLLRNLTGVPAFREFITIKPMQLLTKEEKATCNILRGGYYFADEEDR